jgi:hypothetical protein
LADTNIYSNKENESTSTVTSEQTTILTIQEDHNEASVEVPLEEAKPILQEQFNVTENHEPKATLAFDASLKNTHLMTSTGSKAADPPSQESPRVPTNLEILEDLRSKLLSERMKRRMAEVAASPPSQTKLEPDETLVKPPKKLPSKSFIEYRRDLFKCNDKYAEVDPPGQLIPGELNKDDAMEDMNAARTKSVNASAFKPIDPEDAPIILEAYPKAKVPYVPVEAKSGEDVAMHEILTAINMFVAPEYDIHITQTPSPVPTETGSLLSDVDTIAFTDFFAAKKPKSSVKSVVEVGYKSSPSKKNKNEQNSPTGVQEFSTLPITPTRSRSMDWSLLNEEDDCPQDEKTDSLSHSHHVKVAGYTSLSRLGSQVTNSPAKCHGTGSTSTPRMATGKSAIEQNYGQPHDHGAPVARKIDFSDEESKDEDDEDDSACDEDEHYQEQGQYFTFKVSKK